jgi:hypothetical protein
MLYNQKKQQLQPNRSKAITDGIWWKEIPESSEANISGGGQVVVHSAAQKISYMADLTCGEGGVDPVDYGQ